MSNNPPQYPQYPQVPQYPQGAGPEGTPGYPPPPGYSGGPGWQGGGYPPAPGYGGGPAGPGWGGPPPTRPLSVTRAVQMMRAGAVSSLVALVIGLATHGSFRKAIVNANPKLTTQQVNTAVDAAVAIVVVGGLIGAGLWLWMAWANGRGRNWARITGTVFFGIDTLGMVANLANHVPVLSLVIAVIVWVIGLSTVVLLWRRESSAYFTDMKNAR